MCRRRRRGCRRCSGSRSTPSPRPAASLRRRNGARERCAAGPAYGASPRRWPPNRRSPDSTSPRSYRSGRKRSWRRVPRPGRPRTPPSRSAAGAPPARPAGRPGSRRPRPPQPRRRSPAIGQHRALLTPRRVGRPERRPDAVDGQGSLDVEPGQPGVRVGAAEDRRLQHARQDDVGGEACGAGGSRAGADAAAARRSAAAARQAPIPGCRHPRPACSGSPSGPRRQPRCGPGVPSAHRHSFDRLDDSGVGTAAAEIPGHRGYDLLGRRGRVLLQERDG